MIYADYNGTSPVLPEVIDYLKTRLTEGPYANPNAIHSLGKKISIGMEKCRIEAARSLGANPQQIIFNSGATEGITHAFYDAVEKNPQRKTLLISGIEHSAIVKQAELFSQAPYHYKIVKINTLPQGIIDFEHFKNLLKEHAADTALVAIIAANNETGVIQPYQEIAAECCDKNVPYLCDTTQLIGKEAFNFEESQADYAVLSGHKIGALTGIGALLVKNPHNLFPLIVGGGQERGKRGGTQNYLGIESLYVALQEMPKKFSLLPEASQQRINFENKIKEFYPEAVVMGENAPRLATTTMVAFPRLHGQALQIELESQNIFVTTSSACSDNEPETSKILQAMGVSDEVGRGALRISVCPKKASEHYPLILKALQYAVSKFTHLQ